MSSSKIRFAMTKLEKVELEVLLVKQYPIQRIARGCISVELSYIHRLALGEIPLRDLQELLSRRRTTKSQQQKARDFPVSSSLVSLTTISQIDEVLPFPIGAFSDGPIHFCPLNETRLTDFPHLLLLPIRFICRSKP